MFSLSMSRAAPGVQSYPYELPDVRDGLISHEVEAELHGGELPTELLERQRRVSELGFDAINVETALPGGERYLNGVTCHLTVPHASASVCG